MKPPAQTVPRASSLPARPPLPMMALSSASLPIGPNWSYEVKWDGYRLIAMKAGGDVRLFSRNLKDVSGQYRPIAQAIAALKAKALMLDGELVALDAEGRPSFQALHHQSAAALAYYVFDLLHVDNLDLQRQPLDERRARLDKVMRVSSPPLLRSEPLPGTPAQIEVAVRALGLEGVVAKRRDSRYEPGKRSGAWVKVKFQRRQEFVVGGFKPAAGSFDSLLVGYYEGRDLRFAGKVRTGFTPHSRAAVYAALMKMTRPTCPFANLPSTRTSHWGEGVTAEEMLQLRWVKPMLVVEVAFTEWTRDGNLRHAAFAGVRTDKPAREVRRES